VVKTFQWPELILKHLTGSDLPNCERSARAGIVQLEAETCKLEAET